MAEVAVQTVVALAKAGIDCCLTAQMFRKEADQIGQRLSIIVAQTHQWKQLYQQGNNMNDRCDGRGLGRGSSGKKVQSLKALHDTVEQIFFCMQAASLIRTGSWKAQQLAKLDAPALLQKIRQAENDLTTMMASLNIEQNNAIYLQNNAIYQQNNAIYQRLGGMEDNIQRLLERSGTLPMATQQGRTASIQQQVNDVLNYFQQQAPEVAISPDSGTDATAASDSLFTAGSSKLDPPEEEDEESQLQLAAALSSPKSVPPKVLFEPTPEDLEAITLNASSITFDRDDILGSGGFAEVFRGTYQKNTAVAVKRLKAEARDVKLLQPAQIQRDVDRLAAEALMMRRCGTHPNIVDVIGCTTVFTKRERPMIVMELLHMTLFDVLHQPNQKPISMSHALFLMKGVAGALEYLHLQGIVHHDVKTLNILVDQGLSIAKLGDFGEAKVKGLNTTRLQQSAIMSTNGKKAEGVHVAGTLAYQAPELLRRDVHETSRVVEMYSFGVVVWECLTRNIPHHGILEPDIYAAAYNNKQMLEVPSKHERNLSKIDEACWIALKNVTSSCLSRERSSRPTSSVVVALWHNVNTPKTFDPYIRMLAEGLAQTEAFNRKHTASDEGDSSHVAKPVHSISCLPLKLKFIVIGVVCIGIIVGVAVAVYGRSSNSSAKTSSPTAIPLLESPTSSPLETVTPTKATLPPTLEVTTEPPTLLPTIEPTKQPDTLEPTMMAPIAEPPSTSVPTQNPTALPSASTNTPVDSPISMHDSEIKLRASDGAARDYFGISVAIDGDTIVIGAPDDYTNVNNSGSGSAYVYTRSGSEWTENAKLTASDGAAGDNFGTGVALDGDTIVIGAQSDYTKSGEDTGSAYVYTRTSSIWTEQTRLTASDGAARDWFGNSVAVDGETIVIGAIIDDTENGSNSGSAYVYIYSVTGWTEQAKLTASDGATNDFFGMSVVIDGDTVAVGAWGSDTENSIESGCAYVYIRSGTVWTEQAKLRASDVVAADDYFGDSVAIHGDTLVIGAWADDDNGENSGSAYVYTRSGNAWTEQTKLIASDGAADHFFGNSAAIDGDTIVIGASGDGPNTIDSGSAYVYTLSGTDWTEQAKLFASDGAAHDKFGENVALDGGTIVIGAASADTESGFHSGSVYIFE